MKKYYIFLFFLFCTYILSAQTTPDPPVLERLSVQPDGSVLIEWTISPTPGVDGYIMYTYDPPDNTFAFDTIYDPAATSYLHAGSQANNKPVSYVIAAFDLVNDDFRRSILTDPHTTNYTTLKYDTCKSQMTINWTRYLGWESEISVYNVYAREDNEAYQLIATQDRGGIFFTQNNIKKNVEYCYYVDAVRTDNLTASSNTICFYTEQQITPEFINADYASVTEEGYLEISFTIDSQAETTHYELKKSEFSTGPFYTLRKIDTVPGTIIFGDTIAISEDVYYYKLIAYDNCENEVLESNLANNIIASAKNTDNSNNISWAAYEQWLGGVDYYNIYRSIGNQEFEFVTSVNASTYEYEDDISHFKTGEFRGNFCYYVQAVEGLGNPNVTGTRKTRSNKTCTDLEPEIFMANAFTPNGDGSNDLFKPVLTLIPEKYEFAVYSRWGNLRFQTNNVEEAWDGKTSNGKPAPEGSYIYFLKITTSAGNTIEKKGHVTVYYP